MVESWRPKDMSKYKAEFHGVSRIRSSGVVLTHAWMCKESDGSWHIGGFSTSEEHANQSIQKYCLPTSETKVVPAVKIEDASVAKLW
jgi:hypothetical protein